MTPCAQCQFFKPPSDKPKYGLCEIHKHVKLPAYLDKESHLANVVNPDEGCEVGQPKPLEFFL